MRRMGIDLLRLSTGHIPHQAGNEYSESEVIMDFSNEWGVNKSSDLQLGRKLRDQGLAKLEARRKDWITMCRTFAINHAKRAGQVSINDIRICFELPPDYSDNTWGCILRCKELEPCGFTQATHKEGHARVVRIYRIK